MSKHSFGIKLDNFELLAAEVLRKLWRQPFNFSVIVLFFLMFSFIFMSMQMTKFACLSIV